MPKMPSYKPGKNAIEWWVHFAFCVPGVVVVVRHAASVAPQLALRACRHAVTVTPVHQAPVHLACTGRWLTATNAGAGRVARRP
jgi:hypothetical protein